MLSGELGRRLAVAIVGIPLVLLGLMRGGWVLGGAAAAAAAIGALEFYRLAEARGQRPFTALGTLATAGIVLLTAGSPTPSSAAAWALAILLGVFLGSLALSVWARWPSGDPSGDVGATLTGIVYVGFTLSFIPILRALPVRATPVDVSLSLSATAWVLLPLVVAWVGDSAAYGGGRLWGRAKLAPHASPGKTWMGAFCGLLGSAAAAVVLAWSMGRVPESVFLSLPWAAAAGVVLGAAGQVGDLAESVLKRQAGMKDSGSVFPGHGGMLDRLDGLLFTLPCTWLFAFWAGLVPEGML